MTYPRLLADIGGTHARFAMMYAGRSMPSELAVLPCDEYASLLDAIIGYLAQHTVVTPRWCAIGIATPVTGDRISMTNNPWSFSIRDLQAALGLERLIVINDFTALALALPHLREADLRQIGLGTARPNAPCALLGPGTGLGVAGLLPAGAAQVPVVGEGGHVTLAAQDEEEDAVLRALRRRFGHVSAERALSGPGLVNLYGACCEIAGRTPLALDAGQVTQHALNDDDEQCRRAVEMFFAFLGSTAGNLALTLGAFGGVYVGGGIAPRLLGLMEASSFRARFEAKGRFSEYLREIPTWVITSDFPPALIGAAKALDAAA
jgi:glucokinase